MSEILSVELTEHDRDILLCGLRFVRSSVLLTPREPSSEVDNDRKMRLNEIASLVENLSGAETRKEAAKF